MRSELVVDALNMAVARRRPDAGLFHRRSWPTREELRCEVFDCIGIFYNAGSRAFVVRGPDAWLPVPVRRRESKILRRTRGKGVRWTFGYALTLGGPSFRLQRMAGVPSDLHGHRNS